MFSFVADLLFPGVCLSCERGLSAPGNDFLRALPRGWPEAAPDFFRTDFFHTILGPLKVPARILCTDCWLSLAPASDECRLRGYPSIHVISPFMTGPVLLEVIRFLKFRGGRSAAHSLSWWLAFSLKRHLAADCRRGAPDPLLIPVPLFPSRLAERGYNQADLLARRTAGLLGLEFSHGALSRTRNTKPQSKLCGSQRAGNVRGAFDAAPSAIEGKRIVVIDDLLTTGETMLACVAALQPCRPLSITVLTVGRGADR